MSAHRRSRSRGVVILAAGALLTALLVLHDLIPTTRGLALMVESALPWTWVLVVLLVLAALLRFSVLSIAGALVPALVWLTMFGGYLRPASPPESSDVLVATQNVGAKLPEPSTTAQNIIAQDPDIVTLQEIESLSGDIITEHMDEHFAHSRTMEGVGVWSKWPMSEPEEIDLGLQWPRAFSTTISTDHGDVRFYAVHLPSVRPGQESLRNSALDDLGDAVASDGAGRLIVAGDFNTSTSDRYFSRLRSDLTDTRAAVGGGFGHTWPSALPVLRLDHVLVRGIEPVGDEVVDTGSSDHRAVLASLDVA